MLQSLVETSSKFVHRLFSAVKAKTRKHFRGFSSVGRASDLHSEGQEFESPSLQNAVIAQLVRAQH